MDGELQRLEEELKTFSASPLSEGLLSRMSGAMDHWQDQEPSQEPSSSEPQVIPFPQQKSAGSSWAPLVGVAAALALFGGLLGTLIPHRSGSGSQLSQLTSGETVRQASFIPISGQKKVSSVDAGMVSDAQGVPHQVIRVVREHEAHFQSGGTQRVGLKLSRPQVEYYVVPVSY